MIEDSVVVAVSEASEVTVGPEVPEGSRLSVVSLSDVEVGTVLALSV